MQKFVVHEHSMQPSLLPGDRLLAARRRPRVGDVVVFPIPGGSRVLVKRVAATGPCHVTVDGRLMTITRGGGSRSLALPLPETRRSWTLLDDEIFVLSDDLSVTRADSRVLGPIDGHEAVVVLFRYAPVHRIGRVRR